MVPKKVTASSKNAGTRIGALLACALLGLAPVCRCASTAGAGILVTRSDHGLQFTEAVAVSVNGKDKALSLGAQPKLTSPISKLPSVHVAGTLVKDADSGTIALYEQGKAEFLLPQGLPKNAPGDSGGIWKTAKLSYKKSAQDKAGTEVAAASFVAFLSGGAAELTQFCMDEPGLQLLGGKGKSFQAQIELMSAAVKAYPANPAMAPLDKFVENSMRSRYDQFESGAAGLDALNQGLKFVELSQAVYPKQPEQEKLRKALTERKAWLDRKVHILRGFAAAEQWDALLLGNREFEKYQQSFPDMIAIHTQALKESLQGHLSAGAMRRDDGDFGAAYREYRLASFRKPSDSALREDAMQTWTEYSRRVATSDQGKRGRLQPGQQSTIERNLYFADQNKAARNLDEALKNVRDAESVLGKSLTAGAIAPETLKVLYKKADILGAQEQISEALTTLDEYDLHAVDEERLPADKLRNQLLFTLNTRLKDVKAKLQAAWSEASYNRASELALQGLKMKADDAELLYNAGMTALITRKPRESREYFARYLEVSNTLDAVPQQRAEVRRLVPTIVAPGVVAPGVVVPGSTAPAAGDANAAGPGDPNWLSGKNLSKGVFYCPISLAFQPHIDRIDASNKLKTVFEWDGEKLKSVTPTFDKSEHVTNEKKISFAYDDRARQVVWASDGDEARGTVATDPDEAYKRSSLVVLNNPYVDPLQIQKLTGKNVALGIAGNRFFNPLVWEKLYFFRLTYDESGRVSRAQELSGPKGTPGDLVLELEWSGLQLNAIRGYQGKAKTYERTMQYQDGRLLSEEIQGQGKSSHIKYTYAGNRLVSAESSNDATLDNRSRKAMFVPNSASTQGK